MLPPGALDHRQSCKIGKLPALGQGKESKVFQARLLVLSVMLILPHVGALPALKAEQEKKARKDRLQEEVHDYFRQWLEQDVTHIITPQEKDVFGRLRTTEEKEQFIEQFWHRRDPDPLTASNEFKEEHYRRLAYANERFQSGVPGWKTDRGRIYIIHGQPVEIEKHQPGEHYQRPSHEGGGFTVVSSFEIWRYRHIEGIGPNVEIEFVDPGGSGDYRLATAPWQKEAFRPYFSPWNWDRSPGMHTRTKDNPFTRYETLVRVQRAPQIKFKDLRQLVDVDIHYDSLPFRARQDHFRLNESSFLVPLNVEIDNKNLTFKQEGGAMVARAAIYGIVTSLTNRVAAEFEHNLEVSCHRAELEKKLQSRSLYQKVLILENRMRYRADVVIKDLNSENIGLLRTPIAWPRATDGLGLSSLILTDFIAQLKDSPEPEEMFVIGDLKVLPNLRNQFYASRPFGAYVQVYNAALDQSTRNPEISALFRIERGGKQVKYWSEDAGQSIQFFSEQRLVLAKALPLGNLAPATYVLQVEIEDRLSGQKIATQQKFEIVQDPVAGSE